MIKNSKKNKKNKMIKTKWFKIKQIPQNPKIIAKMIAHNFIFCLHKKIVKIKMIMIMITITIIKPLVNQMKIMNLNQIIL